MVIFKGAHFEAIVILTCVRWNLAYPLSYRQLEEMMQARGVAVDQSTINRWVLKYVPQLEHELRRRKRPVGTSWRLDETYIKVKGVDVPVWCRRYAWSDHRLPPDHPAGSSGSARSVDGLGTGGTRLETGSAGGIGCLWHLDCLALGQLAQS
jgi:hypothetical protein